MRLEREAGVRSGGLYLLLQELSFTLRKKGNQGRGLRRRATSSDLFPKKGPSTATGTGLQADWSRGRKSRLEVFAEVQVRDAGGLN